MLGFIITVILGVVFLTIGLPMGIISSVKLKEMNRLLADGRIVGCIITDIALGSSSVNNVRAKIVTCKNMDAVYGDEIYVSKSVYIPDSRMPQIGDSVLVYVDRDDSSKYFVEVK